MSAQRGLKCLCASVLLHWIELAPQAKKTTRKRIHPVIVWTKVLGHASKIFLMVWHSPRGPLFFTEKHAPVLLDDE